MHRKLPSQMETKGTLGKIEVRQIEFSKLRCAYITVKKFLEQESQEKVKSLETKIEANLYLSGDDNLELLEKFVSKFELEYSNFKYEEHFYSEGELFNSINALVFLLNLSVWLPLKTIELLTFNNLKITKPFVDSLPERKVTDLTFRELLIWYIEREFVPMSRLKYEIKESKTMN